MKKAILALGIVLLFSCSKTDAPVPEKQLTVIVTPEAGGSVSPSSGVYKMGSKINLLATPSAEYLFKEWTGGITGTTNPGNVIMDADKTVTAVFEKREYPLSLTIVGSGTVKEEIIKIAAAATNYKSGTTVRLTPQPIAGFQFKKWSGDDTTAKNPLDLVVSKPINLTCTFEKMAITSLRVENLLDTLVISKKHKYTVKGVYTNGTTIDLSDSVKLTVINSDGTSLSSINSKITIQNKDIIGAQSGKSFLSINYNNISLVDSFHVSEIESVDLSTLTYLTTPANPNAKIIIPVVVINYYPTINGIDLDTKRAPNYSSLDPLTLNQIKERTIDILSMTKYGIEEGSKFRGYNNPDAKEDVAVKIIKYYNVYEIKKTKYIANSKIWDFDFADLFGKLNVKNLVNINEAKEIWVSLRPLSEEYPVVKSENLSPDNFLNIWESNMSSKNTGDISNSSRSNDDLPVYNNSYVVYGYNLHRSFAENLHNRGHQIESQLSYADVSTSKGLFWNKFVGFKNTSDGYKPLGRVGMTHFPPNTTIDYDWANKTNVLSDIENWLPDGGETKLINADRWLKLKYNIPALKTSIYSDNDAQFKWLIYWFQSIPNSNNNIKYNSDSKISNWWDIFYNWDNSYLNNKTLWDRSNVLSKISIKDKNFEAALIKIGIDDKVDGTVLAFNVERVTRLDISESNISDLSGIEYFKNLETLICMKNKVTSVDLTELTNLQEISFFGNQWLTKIDLTKNSKLKSINFALNKLTNIDLSSNLDLSYVEISSNNLSSLDLSKNLKIESVNVSGNPNLKCIKISKEQEAKINNKWEAGVSFSVNCN